MGDAVACKPVCAEHGPDPPVSGKAVSPQERMELAALLMFSLDQWLPFLCY